jgi:hypothetical protein
VVLPVICYGRLSLLINSFLAALFISVHSGCNPLNFLSASESRSEHWEYAELNCTKTVDADKDTCRF